MSKNFIQKALVGVSIASAIAFSVSAGFVFAAKPAPSGVVTITAATGGDAISADTYTSGAYTSLTNPIIAETASGQIGTGDIQLKAPSGFEFNIGNDVDATVSTGACGVSALQLNGSSSQTVTPTSNSVTVTVTRKSTSCNSTITFSGIQVRPATGTVTSGHITKQSGSGQSSISGVSGGTNFGTLGMVAGDATQIAFTQQPSATVFSGRNLAQEPIVAIEDQNGNTVTTDNSTTVSVDPVSSDQSCGGSNGPGTLTLDPINPATAVNGLVSYSTVSYAVGNDVSIKLCASTGSLGNALSDTIDVSSPTAVTVPAMTGGDAISADDTGGSFTSLTDLVFTENATGSIGTGDITLNAPAGFEFNSSDTATAATTTSAGTCSGGSEMQLAATSTSPSSSAITFTVTQASSGDCKEVLTISRVTVRPTAGTPLAIGDITESGSSYIAGIYTDTSLAALTEVPGTTTQYVIDEPPTDGTVDGTINVTVSRADQFGNPTGEPEGQGAGVTLVTDGSATGGGAASSTDGVATWTLSDQVAETVNLSIIDDEVTGLIMGSGKDVTFAPGVATHIAFTQEPSVLAYSGSSFAVKPHVQVEDQFGNFVTSDSSTTITLFPMIAGAETCGDPFANGTITSTPASGATVSEGHINYSPFYYVTPTIPETIRICALASGGLGEALSDTVEIDQTQTQVTEATGGDNIPGSTAGGTFTDLTGPSITETVAGAINHGGSPKDITFNLPAGFEYDTTSQVTATVTSSGTCTGGGNAPVTLGTTGGGSDTETVTPGATTVTVHVKNNSMGLCLSTITWSGIKVRPTANAEVSGDITSSGTVLQGVVPGVTSFGTLNETTGPAPAALDHFDVTNTSGGSTIGSHVQAVSFNVKVTAKDQYGSSFSFSGGSVDLTSDDCSLVDTPVNSGTFSGSYKNNVAVTFSSAHTGCHLVATNHDGSETGTSTSFNITTASVHHTGGGGGGSSGGGTVVPAAAANSNAGCVPGQPFSTTTGHPCSSSSNASPEGCAGGNLFNTITGAPCSANGNGASTFVTAPGASASNSGQFGTSLRLGNTGPEVVALQNYLIAHGYLTVPAGTTLGTFGPLTQAAVVLLQQALGINPASGFFGPITRGRVNAL